VIAERLNLSQQTLRPTSDNGGFDAFFFEAAAVATIERDNHWRIGGVWYDFWLPLAFHVAGFEIKTLPAPILLHLNHNASYESLGWESDFPRLINLLRARGGDRLDSNLMAELLRTRKLRTKDVRVLAGLLLAWLRSHKPLWSPEAGSIDELMTSVLKVLAPPLPILYRLGLVSREFPP
jgi:hypothetical protein